MSTAGRPVASREAYARLRQMLEEAGVEDAGFDAEQLFRHVAGAPRQLAEGLSAEAWRRLQALAARRAQREPLQYILGRWPFLDLELEVGPGVLIPRPETEEVCLAAAGLVEALPAPAVLDLCAGSGALGLGLQSRVPAARVSLVENSPEALVWLRRNAEAFAAARPGLPAPKVLAANALAYHEELSGECLDLILCNPPYVSEAEYAGLAPELYAEPKAALVAPEEGLFFYRVITEKYRDKLRPGGWLVFEIGAGQGEAVMGFFAKNGYECVELRRDMAGLQRMVFGRRG